MKKILFIGLVMLLFGACSVDSADSADNYYFEYVPIEMVEMPEEFSLGQSYTIQYTYLRPTICHFFNDLYNVVDQNVRTIIVQNTVHVGDIAVCEPLTNEVIHGSFDFTVTNSNIHYFKFWQGQDDSGQDVFLEIEVPVIN